MLLDNHPTSVGDHVFKVLRVSSLVEAEVGDLVGMDRMDIDLVKMTEINEWLEDVERLSRWQEFGRCAVPNWKATKGANLCQWCFAKAWKPRLMKSPKLRELSRIPVSNAAMHPIQYYSITCSSYALQGCIKTAAKYQF